MPDDQSAVDSVEALRALYDAPSERALKKQLSALDAHCRAFIAHAPFVVLGTEGDVSPKGDHPGFVRVLDERTLLIPDRAGNNRLDSFRNLLANPKVALLFLIPGMNETLRVNGSGTLTTDAALLAPSAANGKAPKAGLVVHVEEAYLHCAKALVRARLWRPEAWPDRSGMASAGTMLAEQSGSGTAEGYEAGIARMIEEEGREG